MSKLVSTASGSTYEFDGLNMRRVNENGHPFPDDGEWQKMTCMPHIEKGYGMVISLETANACGWRHMQTTRVERIVER